MSVFFKHDFHLVIANLRYYLHIKTNENITVLYLQRNIFCHNVNNPRSRFFTGLPNKNQWTSCFQPCKIQERNQLGPARLQTFRTES